MSSWRGFVARVCNWPGSPYVPWPLILWRCIWYLPYHLVAGLLCCLALLIGGPRLALAIWDDVRMH